MWSRLVIGDTATPVQIFINIHGVTTKTVDIIIVIMAVIGTKEN